MEIPKVEELFLDFLPYRRLVLEDIASLEKDAHYQSYHMIYLKM